MASTTASNLLCAFLSHSHNTGLSILFNPGIWQKIFSLKIFYAIQCWKKITSLSIQPAMAFSMALNLLWTFLKKACNISSQFLNKVCHFASVKKRPFLKPDLNNVLTHCGGCVRTTQSFFDKVSSWIVKDWFFIIQLLIFHT